MTLQVNMRPNASANGGAGIGLLTAAANPISLPDALAQDLVNRGLADPVNWPVPLVTQLTPAAAAAVQAQFNGGLGISPTKSLTAVVIGNSIAAGLNNGPQRLASNSFWASGSDIHTALMLSGGKGLRFGRMTESTRADRWGVYSYSGQRLDTINADLPAQLWAPLVTANVIPEIIIGHSLLENDVAQGRTIAQMTSAIQEFIRDAQARYPSAIIWLMTPRPSFSYNTPTLVASYQTMRDYILSLDDAAAIFVTRLDGYENPASPGTPLAGYTDASVHPNPLGGMLNGRAQALTLNRINRRATTAYRCVSNNFAMIGTGAASGTNVSGTVATGVTHGGSANATSIVMTATQPGQAVAITQIAGAPADTAAVSLGTATVMGLGTQFSPFVRFRVDSGAEQIRLMAFQPRFSDGVSAPFFNFQNGASSDLDGEYRNGDEITLFTPPTTQADVGTAGVITTITPFLRVTRKTGGTGNVLTAGTIQLTVLAAGVGIVA